jgi:hypothetical protein
MAARASGAQPFSMTDHEEWPQLERPGWQATASTLRRWTQIVGKTRMALEPMQNHWWQVPLYVTSRGLGTSVMHVPPRALELEFDFIAHVLEARTSNGQRQTLPLCAGPVADFYRDVQALLHDLGVAAPIWPRPVELGGTLRFDQDREPGHYDPQWARGFWQALLAAHRVLGEFRSGFLGKASPVHFFWGANDLAVTRFSGRRAPPHPGGIPNIADWVTREAYSHEVSSAGFWPGDDSSPQAIFYSYAYPEPAGFAGAPVRPAAARYDATLREFVLPYAAVRASSDPEGDVLAFLDTTYEAAAELGGWERARLERPRLAGEQRVAHHEQAGAIEVIGDA